MSPNPQPVANTLCHRNQVRLIRGGLEYFSLLAQLIEKAELSIHLQAYIYHEDETGLRIARLLAQAVERNVKVYVLVDGFASQDLSRKFIQQLREAGVYFRLFRPLFKSPYFYFGRRLHHKVVVVDGVYALVGGINISDHYNDLPGKPAWLDWAMYAEGEVALSLMEVCKRRIRLKVKDASGQAKNTFSWPDSRCRIDVAINDWVYGKREITLSYLNMFRKASTAVIIMSPYFMPGNDFRKNMAMARRRGVTIKVVLTGISDVAISKFAERYMYQWLFQNGVEIYEYKKNVLHGKLAVYDRKWVTVGSYNVNNISAYASVELNLSVEDAAFSNQVTEMLHKMIVDDCEQITEDKYIRHQGLLRRLAQKGAYVVIRVLLYLFTFYFKQRTTPESM